MKNGIILSPTNDVVEEMNAILLEKVPGVRKCYFSKTSLAVQDRPAPNSGFNVAQDELDMISPPRLPPHRLELKEGAIVMLLKNLNKKLGLCNGTRFVVVEMFQDVLLLRRTIPFDGCSDELFLPKMIMSTDDTQHAGSINRIQFPLRLALCITINKGQGQSYNKVGLYLRRPVFAHGQFFVGVSRCRTRAGLCIALEEGPRQGAQIRSGRQLKRLQQQRYTTLNYVHRHLLR